MRKIAFLFSGQGAQSVGMGKDLYEKSEEARKLYQMGENIRPNVIKTCFESDGSELMKTENAQPCLFLTALAFANELKNAGIKADAVAGFSLGEIPALAFSRILSVEDAFRLVVLRGEKMSELAAMYPGGMVAVLKLEPAIVEEVCQKYGLWAVNYNCPGQISCAGRIENLDGFCDEIRARGGRAVKLAVSGAFHTPYMLGVTQALAEALKKTEIHSMEIPMYSNFSGEEYPRETAEIIEKISLQASGRVRWEQILRNLHAKGVDTFIEVGSGTTLKGFVKRTLPDASAYSVTDVNSLSETVEKIL